MKRIPFLLLVALTALHADPAAAPVDLPANGNGGVNPIGSTTVITVPPTTVSQQTTVQLGLAQPVIETLVAVPPRPPITVQLGADLKLLAPSPGATYGPVQWSKNGHALSATGSTLEIASVTVGDAGAYFCTVPDANGLAIGSDNPTVFVASRLGQHLVNYSVLAQISPAQPTLASGFVVESGPAGATILIRVVGPSLTSFGVASPLVAPKLQVRDGGGNVVGTAGFAIPGYAGLVATTVGAFPLLAGSKDVVGLYYLPPGSYTAEISSGDGGSGVALLEAYEAPSF